MVQENAQSAVQDVEFSDIPELREEDDQINREWVDQLVDLIATDDSAEVKTFMAPLHAADVGDVLEVLSSSDRMGLITLLGDEFDYSALTEVDDGIRLELMDELPNADIARGVQELDSDDAVYILEDIEGSDQAEILAQLPTFERLALRRSLDFPDETAGRRMQTDFIAIPPFWTIGQTIDYMRDADDLPDDFYQIYVVDPSYNLLGTLALDRMLRAKRPDSIEAIMNNNVIDVAAEEDQEEAARLFERYDLVELAVVDDSNRMVGVPYTDEMIETAIELTEGRILGREIHEIIRLSKSMVAEPIELLPNIENVLKSIHGKYQLMVITKGDLLDQESKLSRSGLVPYFDYIEVVSDKTPQSYSDILDRYQIDKSEFLMVGNSLKSDILPILDIGSNAIHIPYLFTWEHEQVKEDTLKEYAHISTLGEVKELLSFI